MDLTIKKTRPKTGIPGFDLKHIITGAGHVKASLDIQSMVSISGTEGWNVQDRFIEI
jgi:hypothetical protein